VHCLTEPMAKLAQDIQRSISVNEDDIFDLQTKEMEKKELEAKLNVRQKVEEGHEINQPRTVCGHRDCIEYRSEGIYNMREKTTIYKTICHNGCYLTDVELENRGDRQLQNCYAFSGNGSSCRSCTHSWMDHLHIKYELRSVWITVKDQSIQTKLGQNASFITQKQKAISEKEQAIAEWKQELAKFKNAAVKFSVFLKNNSITVYNDETLAYLDRLIDEEEGKITVGGPRKRLEDLKKSRREHEQEIATLDEHLKQNSQELGQVLSQEAVTGVIAELYALKYYGKYLKQNHQIAGRAQEVVYREKPRCIRARADWGRPNSVGTRVFWSNDDAQEAPSLSPVATVKQVVVSAGSRIMQKFGRSGGRGVRE
jgi:hypothetical protein